MSEFDSRRTLLRGMPSITPAELERLKRGERIDELPPSAPKPPINHGFDRRGSSSITPLPGPSIDQQIEEQHRRAEKLFLTTIVPIRPPENDIPIIEGELILPSALIEIPPETPPETPHQDEISFNDTFALPKEKPSIRLTRPLVEIQQSLKRSLLTLKHSVTEEEALSSLSQIIIALEDLNAQEIAFPETDDRPFKITIPRLKWFPWILKRTIKCTIRFSEDITKTKHSIQLENPNNEFASDFFSRALKAA